MSGNKDWLPENHEALYNKARQTKVHLFNEVNRIRMGFSSKTPPGQWLDEVFVPVYDEFTTSFQEWLDPATRTTAITTRLTEAQTPFTAVYRQLYGFLKASPLVTEVDLNMMGLPSRHHGHTPVPVPTTIPSFTVDSSVIRHLKVHFRDSATEKKGKPHGVHGAEIRWNILEEAPTSLDDLIHSAFDTKTPFELEFDEKDRSKSVFFALRWENSKGDKGPWSEIVKAIIP